MKTHYEVLGVDRNATLIDIEHGYHHSLSRHITGHSHRPHNEKDRTGVRRLREAYLVLSSPSRRREYDMKIEHAKFARHCALERMGIAVSAAVLVAGLLLLAASTLYRLQHEDVSAAGGQELREMAVLVAKDKAAEGDKGAGVQQAGEQSH